MKNVKTVMAIILLVCFAATGNAQTEPSTPPIFGNVRGEKPMYSHNFGKIKKAPKSHTFTIKNMGYSDIDIIEVKFPPRIAITVMEYTIKVGEEGRIIVTVDPDLMEKGAFYTWCLITTQKAGTVEKERKDIKLILEGVIL